MSDGGLDDGCMMVRDEMPMTGCKIYMVTKLFYTFSRRVLLAHTMCMDFG